MNIIIVRRKNVKNGTLLERNQKIWMSFANYR